MSSPASSLDPLLVAFQLAVAGRYSIDRELGRGGMGIVYLAREVHLDRLVAIKLLPPDRATPSLRERFLREARVAARLSHPSIIPIHAVEEAAQFVYFVMAFVDGETLSQRVRARGPLGASEGARMLRDVAWALAYAHDQGLVHRDVKPDNILVEAATGRVFVADFGIAGAAGDAGDATIAGTPEFMSPEQALGEPLDARSDIYSLGATAWYAFTGRFVFDGATATEVLAKHVTESPAGLGAIGTPVPRKVAALVDRCLAKDPAHRPASAQMVAERLGVALEQRRELPAALRAFVKRTSRLDGGGTLLYLFSLLGGSIGAAALWGPAAGFGTITAGATLVPFAFLTRAARQLSLHGFTHADVGPAFRAEIEQAEEELAVAGRSTQVFVERWLPRIAKVSGGAFVASMLALPIQFEYSPAARVFVRMLQMVALTSWPVTILSLLGYLALRQRRSDVDTEIWSGLWAGRIGRLAFGVARRLIGPRVAGSAMTHRATELSLGLAAEQLFASLPKETRRALGDVPSILHRLQQDAQLLRARYDDVQEALTECSGSDATDGYRELVAVRDATHAKLTDAVGALETLRLDLLRLHAGSGSIGSVTTHLGIAAEVSEEVARLVAAHHDVEGLMRFPRERAATPV